jgi:hypothetical protein
VDKNMYDSYGKRQYRAQTKKCVNVHIAEVYRSLNIDLSKYHVFTDICSNPNVHTLHILNNNPTIQGTGISLAVSKNGYPPNPKITDFKDRYHIIFPEQSRNKSYFSYEG